jgi:hypothetical protein
MEKDLRSLADPVVFTRNDPRQSTSTRIPLISSVSRVNHDPCDQHHCGVQPLVRNRGLESQRGAGRDRHAPSSRTVRRAPACRPGRRADRHRVRFRSRHHRRPGAGIALLGQLPAAGRWQSVLGARSRHQAWENRDFHCLRAGRPSGWRPKARRNRRNVARAGGVQVRLRRLQTCRGSERKPRRAGGPLSFAAG